MELALSVAGLQPVVAGQRNRGGNHLGAKIGGVDATPAESSLEENNSNNRPPPGELE